MILFVNVFLTEPPAVSQAQWERGDLKHSDRLDVFKFSLSSLSSAYKWHKVIIYYSLDEYYSDREQELEDHIYSEFAPDNIVIRNQRNEKQSQWQETYELFDSDLIFYAGNHDHIFVGNKYNFKLAIDDFKNEADKQGSVSCSYSHFPEMSRFLYSYDECYNTFKKSLLDAGLVDNQSDVFEATQQNKHHNMVDLVVNKVGDIIGLFYELENLTGIECNHDQVWKLIYEYILNCNIKPTVKCENKNILPVPRLPNCVDAVQILSKKLYHDWWFTGEFEDIVIGRSDNATGPSLTELWDDPPDWNTFTFTEEYIRHFDGYNHVAINNEGVPALDIPEGFFDKNIKIKIGYDQYDPQAYNINTFKDYYYAYNKNGADFLLDYTDLPSCIKERVGSIDISQKFLKFIKNNQEQYIQRLLYQKSMSLLIPLKYNTYAPTQWPRIGDDLFKTREQCVELSNYYAEHKTYDILELDLFDKIMSSYLGKIEDESFSYYERLGK